MTSNKTLIEIESDEKILSPAFTERGQDDDDEAVNKINLLPSLYNYIDNSSYCDLPESVRLTKIEDQKPSYLDLCTGYIYSYEKKSKLYKINQIIPAPTLKRGIERARYYLQMILLSRVIPVPGMKDEPWDKPLMAWSCAAAIRASRGVKREKNNLNEKEGFSIFKDPRMFRDNAPRILMHFWEAMQFGRTEMLISGDDTQDIEIYVQNKNNNLFTCITTLQLKQLILKFIESVYGSEKPKDIDNEKTRSEFFTLLTSVNAVSKDTFVNRHDYDGRGFADVFAAFIPGESQIVGLPYTDQLLCTSKLKENYRKATFEEPEKTESNIVVSKDFKDFLLRFVRHNKSLGLAIKGLIRGVIAARNEGDIFQTCLYLYGPPSSGKSEIVKVIEMFADPTTVKRMTRYHNRFSASQFRNCRLLIVNDLENFRRQDLENLKPILGRDTVQAEIKYKSQYETIQPKCQVILVSNHPPENFPALKDQGMDSKLIVIGLDDLSRVKKDERIPQFHKEAEKHVVDLFNWAIHGKEDHLRNHIRAESYHDQREAAMANAGLGIHSFIAEQLMYPVATGVHEAFLPAGDLFEALKDHAERIHDGELLNRVQERNTKKELCQEISFILKSCYKKDAPYGRYSKLDNRFGDKIRPYGLKHLGLVDGKGNISSGFEPLVYQATTSSEDLSDLLMCSTTLVHLSYTDKKTPITERIEILKKNEPIFHIPPLEKKGDKIRNSNKLIRRKKKVGSMSEKRREVKVTQE